MIVDGMTLGRIVLVKNYQVKEDVAARVAMKHYMGRSTNIKKLRYIVDDDAAVPTQDALNTKVYTLVVHMKKMTRERLIQCVILL